MAITNDFVLRGGLKDSDQAASAAYDDQVKKKMEQKARDDGIANLIKGKQFDEGVDERKYARHLSTAEQLRAKHGVDTAIDAGDISIGAKDVYGALLKQKTLAKPELTPAETEAEKDAGKAIQTYAVSGGSAGMDKNQEALTEVEKDLVSKRDMYDRGVGKALGWSPKMLGIFGPSEKARMDKAQAGAVGNIKATDSNPTQVLIDQTMSRVYDPAASNEQNAERIRAEKRLADSKRAQIEAARSNYDATGYATVGGSAPSTAPRGDKLKSFLQGGKQAPAASQNSQLDAIMQKIQELEAKKAGR